MERTKVFVSYSQEDRDWLNRFSQHIAVLERRGLIQLWSDTRIAVGANWENEIESALSEAKVAVLLVSPAFLSSKFIWTKEMPRILAHAAQGMDILPLIARPCAWRLEEDLAQLQARPTADRALSLGSESQVDSDLSAFAYELPARIGRSPAAVSPPADVLSLRDATLPMGGSVSLIGEWKGAYNGTREMRLLIREQTGGSFRGNMEYRSEGTVTIIDGVVYESWSHDDVWAQIKDRIPDADGVAIRFRETGYEREGSNPIGFNGEYYALATESNIYSAWFSGRRLVGVLALERM